MSNETPASSLHRTVFRVVAFAEALSWLGLLIGMFFKRVVEAGEGGVKVFGPIHGTIFIAYVVTCLWVARSFRWSPKVLGLALVSSLPPFCTALFEIWADRKGYLRTQTQPGDVPDPAA